MRSTTFAVSAAFLATLVAGQTFTDCNPTEKKCPSDPALGRKLITDFTKGKSDDWELADGTTLTYDGTNGAAFSIAKVGNAPTVGLDKYIMFGKVEVVMRSSAGQGTVSSFILESSDLDEIDWEWLGSDHGNVQTNFFGKGNTTTYDRGQFHPISDPITTFHTYTIDWTAESTKWYIDGALVRTLNFGDALALGGKNYPQTPMKVKMGSWIGCASAEAAKDPKTKYTCEWAGGPIDTNGGPYNMYVKSVSIEDYGCASEYSYGDLSGSFQSIVSTGTCSGDKTPSKPVKDASTTGKPSSTTSGALFVETKTAINTTSAEPTNSVSSGASKPATTLTTAGGSKTQAPAVVSSTTASSTPAQISDNAATGVVSKKHGGIDVAVMVLGLGMGYFFM